VKKKIGVGESVTRWQQGTELSIAGLRVCGEFHENTKLELKEDEENVPLDI
jgi:hypothetical protein